MKYCALSLHSDTGLERSDTVWRDAPRLKTVATLTDVLSLVPKAHMAAHNHRGSDTLPTLGSASTAYIWRTDTHTRKTLRHRKQTRERTEKEAVT